MKLSQMLYMLVYLSAFLAVVCSVLVAWNIRLHEHRLAEGWKTFNWIVISVGWIFFCMATVLWAMGS